jgi:hypothetical protein
MLATASPAAAATAYAATAAASSAKRRKLLSTAETAAASEAEKLAAGAWLAIHRALHFLVASLPFHRRFSATSADHLLKLQPLLCNVLGAASIAAVYAGPTITVSAAVTAADTLAHTAAAAEVAKAAVAAIGSLAREMGADGVKVMHHQLCTRAQLEEITTYTTKPAATTIFGGAAAVYLGMNPNDVNTGMAIGGVIGLVAFTAVKGLVKLFDRVDNKDIVQMAKEVKDTFKDK